MKKIEKQIHILGPGAMGLLWATTFLEQKWDVTLIHKKLTKQLRQKPLYLEYLDKTTQYKTFHATPSEITSKIKILMLSVKAHQVIQAIKPLLSKLDSKTIIILMQNGAGSDQQLLRHYPQFKKNQVIQAVTTHGALKINPYTVRQTGKGYCWLGFNPCFSSNIRERSIPKKLEFLLEFDLISGWKKDIREAIWKKLIINATINPLTAILQCKNGDLLEEETLALMAEIVTECCFIARSTGFRAESSTMFEEVKQVCIQTAENQSSMLQDVQNGRLTEIDYINQYLVDTAKKYTIETPWNNCLIYMIKELYP